MNMKVNKKIAGAVAALGVFAGVAAMSDDKVEARSNGSQASIDLMANTNPAGAACVKDNYVQGATKKSDAQNLGKAVRKCEIKHGL